jgi:hypothetical protein
VVVDSAFSLQWLSGGSLDQANRAYALASCVDCETVAVAFQALIATGPTGPAVPENLAVAVNSECDTCLTRAVAVQLVVTLERSPSDEARGEIRKWWDRLDALRGAMGHLSPDEVHARLLHIRAAMLEVLAPYGRALPSPSDASAEPADVAVEGETPVPGETPSAAETQDAALDSKRGAAGGAISGARPEKAVEEEVKKEKKADRDAAVAEKLYRPATDKEPVVDEEPLEKVNEAKTDASVASDEEAGTRTGNETQELPAA